MLLEALKDDVDVQINKLGNKNISNPPLIKQKSCCSTFNETIPFLGVGLDSCIKPLQIDSNLLLVQTTDFFYPLIENPYNMGRIACANVLSDLYAAGVTNCDNMLMLLAPSQSFTDSERDAVISAMIRGFRDCACEAETQILGGQTIVNPWVLIGGVATSVCRRSNFFMPNRAVPGDVLVLTKPLGTQVAVNAYQWLRKPDAEKLSKIENVANENEIVSAYLRAEFNMMQLNRTAAKLMLKYGAHAATDVTGFGIVGHADNLALHQLQSVQFQIHTFPVISKMAVVEEACGRRFGLFKGTSAETSGGLLIAFPSKEYAEDFCKEFQDVERAADQHAWIVGDVVSRETSVGAGKSPAAIIVNGEENRCHIIEVPC